MSQNLRKESGFEVTDKINIMIKKHESLNKAINQHMENVNFDNPTIINLICVKFEINLFINTQKNIPAEITSFSRQLKLRTCKLFKTDYM